MPKITFLNPQGSHSSGPLAKVFAAGGRDQPGCHEHVQVAGERRPIHVDVIRDSGKSRRLHGSYCDEKTELRGFDPGRPQRGVVDLADDSLGSPEVQGEAGFFDPETGGQAEFVLRPFHGS